MTKPIIHHFIKNKKKYNTVPDGNNRSYSWYLERKKIYQELGLESPASRCWFRKICFFLKILKNRSLDCLFRTIPQTRSSYITRNSDEIPHFKTQHNFYKNSFLPSATIEWNNLDEDLRNGESYTLFRSSILKFIRLSPNIFDGCQNIMGIRQTPPRLSHSA